MRHSSFQSAYNIEDGRHEKLDIEALLFTGDFMRLRLEPDAPKEEIVLTAIFFLLFNLVFFLPAFAGTQKEAAALKDDPYIWLEEVEGQKALDWVKEQNKKSTDKLAQSPEFIELKKRLLAIMDSKEKIPYVSKHGKYYYNFWKDQNAVRGVWRRTSFEEYKKPNPDWETVLDVDKLAADEKANWVWHGASVLKPERDRCLVFLSRGGADANVMREFDLNKKEFVKDGFTLPEAKMRVSWRNRDTLYVGTDFGPGSMTKSGYPRLVKEWKRGTDLKDAKLVFEGKESDVSVSASVAHDHGYVYEWISRAPSFFTSEEFILRDGKWLKIDKPDDANIGTFGKYALISLRTDWTVGGKTYKAGAYLIEELDDYLKGERNFEVLFEPTERKSMESSSDSKNYLFITELDNVASRPYLLVKEGEVWKRSKFDAPGFGTISVHGIDSDESDEYFMYLTDFLTPSTVYWGNAAKPGKEEIKKEPVFFKADDLQIQQFECISKDGTKIPYFQVGKKDLKLDGSNPTLLYGYGGFEVPMLASYNPKVGAAWLERGGVYVLANIRGGSEFGPKWHEAARKENRQRAYDDFIAVAEDLIARKVTAKEHLGIRGASNGGLLMGVMLTQRPDLFGAIHCGVPLLDMRRYNKLLAGASWMDEYGDPDKPEEWAYISKYSPYQNLQKDKKYPPILFTTSTRDDRVHPGHARKMVARMKELGHDVTYYENIEGGHGAAANNEQAAFMDALAYEFLWNKLK